MKQQLLLLDDVVGLGRSGDVVTAKPGFVRNFLIPKQKAVVADKHTLKLQAKLKEEREKRAAVDRKEAEALAAVLAEVTLSVEVKVDPDGKMYGSVSTADIARLLQEQGHAIDRKNVTLAHAIKSLGKHTVTLKLKEGVPATCTLETTPEGGVIPEKVEEVVEEVAQEEEAAQ